MEEESRGNPPPVPSGPSFREKKKTTKKTHSGRLVDRRVVSLARVRVKVLNVRLHMHHHRRCASLVDVVHLAGHRPERGLDQEEVVRVQFVPLQQGDCVQPRPVVEVASRLVPLNAMTSSAEPTSAAGGRAQQATASIEIPLLMCVGVTSGRCYASHLPPEGETMQPPSVSPSRLMVV